MADIRLAKPAAGTTQTVSSAPDGRFIFDFPADAATLTRNGDDLVLSFEDGSSIQLQGFYTTYSKEEMPSFQVEGVEISGQDFFAALGEDLMPAAGPAASSASRGGRYNEYGGSDLLDGIDHLGRLDIGFDGATQLATDTVEPSAPEVDIDYDVTIAAGPEAGPVDLTVYEGGLAGGSQAGQAGTPTTASGSLNINAPDGVASIVIGGVVVFENGKMTGNVVTTDEGTLAVTGYDPATGKLDFSYTLDRNTTEHDKSDPATDTQISHDLTVTVTDTDGDSASTTITVNVVDDVPTVGSFSHKMSEGDAVPVVGNALSGAVAGADGADFAWDANQNGHFGTITLNADGTYSYRLDNDNATVKALSDGETLTEEFTYTYTDADGDVATGKVTITINGVDNGVVVTPSDPEAGSETLTVHESGLVDGSTPGAAPTTAEGSLTISAPDGVASIVIDGKEVVVNGALTGYAENRNIPTDEGVLTVTGFDAATGKLTFTYRLTGNTTEHGDKAEWDTQVSHDFTVTVTDVDNSTATSTITVTIVDDMPTLEVDEDSFSGAYGEGIDGTVDFDFGADRGEGAKIELCVNGGDKVAGVLSEDGKTWTFDVNGKTVTLDAETGEFHYDLPASGSEDTYTFQFTVTDADGDVVSNAAPVEVKVEGTDLSGVKGSVTGDDDNVLTGQAVDVAMPELPEGVTLVANQTVNVTDEDGKVYGQLIVDAEGNVTFRQTEAYSGEQHGTPGESEKATGFTGSLDVTLADGTTSSITVDVSILDDVPMLEVGKPVTDMKPGDSGDNLVKVDEEISFINYKQIDIDENGKPVYAQTTAELSTKYWNDQITISATKVTYGGVDEWGNKRISTEDPTGMSLDYSFYNGGGKQYYKGTPPQEDRDKGIAIWDGKSWYRKAPESDWGLTVNGGEGQGEIQASDNTSEAVVINLKGYAYGMTIDFGAFFAGKSSDEDPAAGTGYDNVSEKALITFYKDGDLVYSTVVYGTDSGEFTFNTGDVVLEGFDKVVVSAVDNSTDKYKNESSDFTIQGFDFITKRNDPIIINKGTVTAEPGADGFADAYADSYVQFDLAGMVNEDSLSEDGTSGTVTVLVDGIEQTVKLELSEGSSGESILTGTLQESGEDGKPVDGEQLFTATLDKDGNWTMEQYEQFRVPGDGQESNQFELVFKTEDADGDVASTTVNVPLEVVDQTPATDTSIGNGDDTITITGGEGIAGTVAAGDSGGVEVQTTVQPGQDYNISIMLDLSGSMADPLHSGTNTSRIEMAVDALKNFFETSLQNHDGDISLQLVGFGTGEMGTRTWTIEGDASDAEKQQVYDEFASQLNAWQNAMNSWYSQGTNYEAAMEKATEWFSKDTAEGGVAGNGGENLAFFISDGEPTYSNHNGGGNSTPSNVVEDTLHAAQDLQNAGGGVHVNAIGIGTSDSLSEGGQKILDLIDNTGGSGTAQTEYPHEGWVNVGTWFPDWKWQWTTSKWKGDQPLAEGDSDLVNSKDGLTAALIGGGVITSTDLADAGDDEVDASASTSSVIVYGDVLNTDRLRYELIQNKGIEAALVAAGIDYGSGADVFQWLENAANANALTGTKFEGWTHDDSVKYMLQHAEELGYETRVDADGDFYLVKADGTVLNMDGAEADNVELDTLTGRGGGNDTIIGSQADDVIYGQEGNDLLVGDAPSESGEGSTVGSIEGTTVASIKAMDTDDLDAFIQSVEGPDADGDDRLFGGTGDDVLLGMGGDDYIDGGAGEDAIFGGSGNDIIVYDSNDYLVSGGSGIDFMVSDNSTLTLTELLSGGKNGNEGPIVSGIEVLLKGEDALSLTSLDQLAKDYGITLDTNAEGKETLTLDMGKWTYDNANDVYTSNDGNLTLETNLTPVDASDPASEAVQQQVFTLEHSNG